MTEEAGDAAEERRRIARAEIMRRAAILESRRGTGEPQPPLESFDTLVDQDGKLRTTQGIGSQFDTEVTANSTAVYVGASQPLWRGSRQTEVESTASDRDRLHLDIPADTSSHHPSESVLEFTPTSEAPAEGTAFDPFSDTPKTPQSPVSASASSNTEGHSEIYYAHPDSMANAGNRQGLLLADLHELSQGGFHQHDVSSAPSTAGSFSHVGKLTDASSDGTMSDLGDRSVGGVATPASWSEVGSVISSEDAGHHPLL